MPPTDLQSLIDAYLASSDPLPREATHVIGDGDFRAIGAEFLRHLVNIGGLTPHDDVLDVGCGFGRIALPLAWRPSFAFATSVFTHLEEATAARYLAELGALLWPGGKLFITAFLLGEGAPLAGPGCAFPFAAWARHFAAKPAISQPGLPGRYNFA